MPVTEDELRLCEEKTSASAEYVLKSGLTLRKCDEKATRLAYLELESGAAPSEGFVDDDSIESWFEEGQRPSTTAKLRLLSASEDESKDLPFTRKAWVTISQHLDLSLDHFRMVRREDRSRMISFWKDRRQEQDVCDAHFIKIQGAVASWTFISFLLLIHHRPSTNTTHGLILTRGEKGSFTSNVISQLKSQFSHLGKHPLFTATAVWKCVVAEHSGDSMRMWKDVAAMNERLNGFVPENYYTTGEGRKGTALDNVQWATERVDSLEKMESKPREIDYLRETKVAQSVALEQSFFLEILNKQGIMMRRVIRQLEIEAKGVDERSQFVIADIHAALEDLATDNEAQLGHVKRNQADIGTMSQMLFHFMALEEGRLSTSLATSSKDIAESSMRDASAMKSISVLTMVFLPATAVASVFSTPFFDWNDTRNSMAVRGFRMFWIVTIPLTVVVLFVWVLAVKIDWTRWRNWRELVGRRNMDEADVVDDRRRRMVVNDSEERSQNVNSKV